MNFLGHLYFSNNEIPLMKANIYGDFFKGNKYETLPEIVVRGVKLHRAIDNFIDTHEVVNSLQRLIQKDLPKVASIATDLFFDHLLAKHWNKFSEVDLDTFLEKFYIETEKDCYDFAPRFEKMMLNLRKYKYMNQYVELEGLDKLSQAVSARINFENTLKNGKAVFIKYEKEIEKAFFAFMGDANVHLKELASK